MTAKVQILRTETAGAAPSNLLPGELAIEMNTPTRLWVGVPNYLDGSGKKLLFDSGSTLNNYYTKPEADSRFVKIPGDTMTGTLTINADLRLWDAGATFYGTLGHKIARMPDTGRLLIGGGQDVVEIINPLRADSSIYAQGDVTGAGNISGAGAVNAGISMYCGGDITANGNFQTANWVRCGDIDISRDSDCRIFFRGLDYHVKGIVFQDSTSGHDPSMVMRNTYPGNDPNDVEADVSIQNNGMVHVGWGFMSRAGYVGIMHYTAHNFYWDGSGCQVWIDSNNIGYTGTVSDYRTKKDIAPLPSMWDTVKALNPIKYTQREFNPANALKPKAWKDGEIARPMFVDDANERWGFLAHELQETTIATAATGVKDSPDTIQSPNPFTLIAALTKALQEAMTRIEQLEALTQPAKA